MALPTSGAPNQVDKWVAELQVSRLNTRLTSILRPYLHHAQH